MEITPLDWIIITGLWFVLHKSTDGWFFFYLQEKEIVYGKGCWCCFFNWKGKWNLVFLWLHTYLQIWVKPAVTWHSFVFGNCSLNTVAIINFFRVGRVGKPYYILHSEVKEIYNTSYTVTILYGMFVLRKQKFWFSFNIKICGKEEGQMWKISKSL